MFSLMCTWTSGWVNNRDGGDFRRHRPHYDVTVMSKSTRGSQNIKSHVLFFDPTQKTDCAVHAEVSISADAADKFHFIFLALWKSITKICKSTYDLVTQWSCPDKPWQKPWPCGKAGARGRFKNTCELLHLRAHKFSLVNKIHIFQCTGQIFCVEFQRYPLKFRTKYLTNTLKDMIFIQHLNLKSS